MFRRKNRQIASESGEANLLVRSGATQEIEPIPIPQGDALESILMSVNGPVELSTITIDSFALSQLRAANVSMIVPLIGQGELLGALYLGDRLSDQPYSADDRRLLTNLASQVAPAMKVAQLVHEQQTEAKERERIQQELQVAALIQQTLLPKELPSIDGWHVEAFYRPAQAVGGDFYDFVELQDGRLGVVIGDVTDKGVPAALVMATCRSMLRAAALNHDSPSAVLREVNTKLVPEIPPAMFVTCLYAIIDTDVGEVVFANAGHNLPYVRTRSGVDELRATGMPLGLMSDMDYDETSYRLKDGEVLVLTSDGITEAHNPEGEMYGFARLMGRVASKSEVGSTCDGLIADLAAWTGPDLEQEDDITLVVISRLDSAKTSAASFDGEAKTLLASFAVPSEEGNERLAIEHVARATAELAMAPSKLERLKTAVGETVMNAMEHGNEYDPELDVDVEVWQTSERVTVKVRDHGDNRVIPNVETPDIEAKLAGEQTPRGWGLFLVSQMVDEVNTDSSNGTRTVELIVEKKEKADAE